MSGHSSLSLSFPRLTSFSWRGVQSQKDLLVLGNFLQASKSTLRSLVIDVMDWQELRMSTFEPSYFWQVMPGIGILAGPKHSPQSFAVDVLKIPPSCSSPIFSLQSLTLSFLSLKGVAQAVACAFNFAALSTLRLIDCAGAMDWLQEMLDTKQVVNLKTFEFLIESDCLDFETSQLSDFLSTFQGLEELYVKILDYSDYSLVNIYKGLVHQKLTLRSLVLHDSDLNESEDLQDPLFIQDDRGWSTIMEEMLLCSKLSYFGVSETSAFLV